MVVFGTKWNLRRGHIEIIIRGTAHEFRKKNPDSKRG